MASIHLPENLEKRLAALCKGTHHTPKYYIKKAVEECIEDLEAAKLGDAAYEEYLKDGKKSVPLEDIRKRLGLPNRD